jgi:uncharacterized membrane protein YfcA
VGLDTCGATSWTILSLFCIFLVLVSLYNIREVRREQRLKKDAGYELAKSDINTISDSIWFPVLGAFFSSWLGGIFGLGGGFIYNPIQMSIGIAPSVAASTSMYMIMLTYSASTFMIFIYGKLIFNWSAWFLIWCGMGVFVGMSYFSKLMKKTNRQSYVAISLAIILTVAFTISAIYSISDLIEQEANGLDIYHGDAFC